SLFHPMSVLLRSIHYALTTIHYLWNFISTVTCTGTGFPFFSAGLNFHFLSVSTAACSKACSSLRSTRTASTRPFVLTPTSITTVPCRSASTGRSGNFGSGAWVALGGLMPVVTRSKREKVWSSEKSAGEVERVEEVSDREVLLCAQEEAGKIDSDSASAISMKMRIEAPEVVQKVLSYNRCAMAGRCVSSCRESLSGRHVSGARKSLPHLSAQPPVCRLWSPVRIPIALPHPW